jgi:phage terminase small subunit
MTKPKILPEDDDSDLGPAMRQLTEKQRKFVQIYLEQPLRDGASTAAAAGYSTGGKSGVGIRFEAYRLLRSEKVLAAIREELDKRFRSDAVIGRSVLMEIALDKEHPQRLKAATALLDRGGFHSMSEQRISVTHQDLGTPAMIERIKTLAVELGMDPAKLLGHNGTGENHQGIVTTMIEAEAIEVAAAPVPRASRYIRRGMAGEYEKAGWVVQPGSRRDPSDDDQVEVLWTREGMPVEPNTRPMTS